MVGVLFTARDSAALTGISNHPGHEELFLYQQGGPNISLNIEVFGPGTVAGTSGINCLMSCTYEFPLGTDLSLFATPDTGMLFVRWEEDFGGCADDLNPCELIIDRSKTLRAYFVDPNEQIFVNGFE